MQAKDDFEQKFSTTKVNFCIEDNENEVKIKEVRTIDDYIQQFAREYCFKKDEFIMQEALKRMPAKTLEAVKEKIEKELEKRKNNHGLQK